MFYLKPKKPTFKSNKKGETAVVLRQIATLKCHWYLQPVSLRRLMALDRRRTQPRNPAPCFLCIFLWFHTLMVIESDFPMYLRWNGSRMDVCLQIINNVRMKADNDAFVRPIMKFTEDAVPSPTTPTRPTPNNRGHKQSSASRTTLGTRRQTRKRKVWRLRGIFQPAGVNV